MATNRAFEESQEIPISVFNKDKIHTPAENEKVYSFDEALALAKVGVFHYFVQIVCGMCLLTAVVETTGMSIVMPFIDRDIPSTTAEKGLLASASFFGVVMSSHAVGFLSDTWGRAKTMRTTLSISFLTSFVSVFSVNIWMLIVFRFLTGFIMSACQGSVFNFVGEFHSSKTRAKYVTMLSMFATIAMIFMPTTAMIILPLKLNANVFGLRFESWRLLMLIFTFMRTFPIIGLFVIPETPKFSLVHDDHDGTIRTMQLIYSKNTGKPKSEYPVRRIAGNEKGDTLKNVHGVKDAVNLIWSQTVPLFEKSRILQTLNFSVIMFLLSGIAHGCYMWVPTILKQQADHSVSGLTTCEIMHLSSNETINLVEDFPSDIKIETEMFKILIAIGCVMSVTYFMFSLIINAIGKRTLMFIMIIVPATSCLTLQIITSVPMAIVNLTVIMSLSNCIGIVGTMVFEFFPTNVGGMAMNLIMMIARIGSAVGSSVLGLMIYTNCDIWFYVAFGLCGLLLILAILLPKTEKKLQTKIDES